MIYGSVALYSCILFCLQTVNKTEMSSRRGIEAARFGEGNSILRHPGSMQLLDPLRGLHWFIIFNILSIMIRVKLGIHVRWYYWYHEASRKKIVHEVLAIKRTPHACNFHNHYCVTILQVIILIRCNITFRIKFSPLDCIGRTTREIRLQMDFSSCVISSVHVGSEIYVELPNKQSINQLIDPLL